MNARAPLFALAVLTLHAGAEPAVVKTKWRGFDALALSDGRSEVVVVPALGGRALSYGLASRRNLASESCERPAIPWRTFSATLR